MAIYTKKGDYGETSLYEEESTQRKRVSKDSLRVETLGAIDELTSFLGIAKIKIEDKKTQNIIGNIQKNLLTIGSIISGSKLRFSKAQTRKLEKLIDVLEGELPVLKNFIVAGGHPAAAYLQYARSLARRSERAVVSLSKLERVKPQILTYLNRLSDALFMLARNENYKMGKRDEVWSGERNI